jgi:membrane protease YdiL (CAAX protease family)
LEEPLLPKNQSTNSTGKSPHWWADPYLWGFILLFGIALIASPVLLTEWLSVILFSLGTIPAVALVIFLTRKQSPFTLEIPRPAVECWAVAGWYVCYMILSTLMKGGGVLADEFPKWLWFVILPVLLLWIVSRRSRNLKVTLQSVGLHRQGLGRALLLGLSAFVVLLPFIIMSMPSPQIEKLHDVFQEPFRAMIIIPVSLLLSLFTAGFTEEVFFRGILQSRLAKAIGSEMRSCLLTAFLFGIYHLPYAYFLTSWQTHGNLLWSVTSVLTEQMVGSLILGVLWMRTRNLAASILVHSLINVIPIMTAFNFNIRFG